MLRSLVRESKADAAKLYVEIGVKTTGVDMRTRGERHHRSTSG
jgi:hypothetical protein